MAEATLASWTWWVSLQAALAWWLFATRDSPLPLVPRRMVPALLGKRQRANIVARDRVAGALKRASDEELVDKWVEQWLCFSINHGIGGLAMLMGIRAGNAGLWRIGLTVETGEDLLHFGQMAAALFGVGPCTAWPWRAHAADGAAPHLGPVGWPCGIGGRGRDGGVGPCTAWGRARVLPMALHHTLGLLAGVPAYFLFADWPDVQLFGLIMLGAPVPGMALEALLATFDQSTPGLPFFLSIILSTGNFVFWVYCRFVLFLPICCRVLPAVYRQHGLAIILPMGLALLSFTLFNLLVAYIMCLAIYRMVTAVTHEERSSASRLIVRSASHRRVVRTISAQEFHESAKVVHAISERVLRPRVQD